MELKLAEMASKVQVSKTINSLEGEQKLSRNDIVSYIKTSHIHPKKNKKCEYTKP